MVFGDGKGDEDTPVIISGKDGKGLISGSDGRREMSLDLTDTSDRTSKTQNHLAGGKDERVEANSIVFSMDT